ncbi:unnamed protein product, partial [Polarella glacialis]
AIPYCLTIFPEGTRLTPEKLLDSQEFLRSRKLPVFQNVLCPRVKGFWSAVNGTLLDTVYDTTIVAGATTPQGNVLSLAQGKPAEFHLYMERVDPKDIPKEEEPLNKWLMSKWEIKEGKLERFHKEGHLGGDRGTAGRRQLTVRASARNTVIGAVLWWVISCLGFVRFCVMLGFYKLLFGIVLGTVLMITLVGAIMQQVHFKHSEAPKKS